VIHLGDPRSSAVPLQTRRLFHPHHCAEIDAGRTDSLRSQPRKPAAWHQTSTATGIAAATCTTGVARRVVNFSISAAGNHDLIVFTLGGMGRPNYIAAFDVQGFCVACKAAAGCI
jgi:hypothetical protein